MPIGWGKLGGPDAGRRGCFAAEELPGFDGNGVASCDFPDHSTEENEGGGLGVAAAAAAVGSLDGFDVSAVEEETEGVSVAVTVVAVVVLADRLDVSVLPAAVSVAAAADVVVPGFVVAFADNIAFAAVTEAEATKVTTNRSYC